VAAKPKYLVKYEIYNTIDHPRIIEKEKEFTNLKEAKKFLEINNFATLFKIVYEKVIYKTLLRLPND
jgi:hypothetical protein